MGGNTPPTIFEITFEGIVLWLCRHRITLIGYVVSGAGLCVWAEFIMLATNRTEAVVNESRAELHLYKEVELRSWRRSDV